MKRLFHPFLFLISCLVLVACGENEPKMASVIANVNYDGKSAYPSFVQLYNYNDAKNFDNSYESACYYGDYRKLKDINGNIIKPAFTSSEFLGVNTFENVPQGKYIIIAMYKPSGYSWPMHYFYGYKIINVDNSLSVNTINFARNQYLQETKCFVKF